MTHPIFEQQRLMRECEQFPGYSVMDHGYDVFHAASDLIDYLTEGKPLGRNIELEWRLPDWLYQYRTRIADNLYNDETISLYLIYHDIGKPHCRVVDDEGKVHFPDHAAVSKRVFQEAYGDRRQCAADLIGDDMVIHTATAEELEERLKEWTPWHACILLIAAFAELHSNARFFGGIETNSFKAKWKKLDRRGKQICKHYFGKDE